MALCYCKKEIGVRDASFFVDPSSIEEGIVRIVGTDLNHMKNVLRMKPGEEVLISDGTGKDYNCQVKEYGAEEGILVILRKMQTAGNFLPESGSFKDCQNQIKWK